MSLGMCIFKHAFIFIKWYYYILFLIYVLLKFFTEVFTGDSALKEKVLEFFSGKNSICKKNV